LLVSTVVLVSAPARADVIVMVNPAAGNDFAAMYGISRAMLEANLATEISEVFNLVEPKKYLSSFADAAAFSSKGLGVDYASNFDWVTAGIGVNLSLANDEGFSGASESDRPIKGVAPNASLQVGVHLGKLASSLDGLRLFFNGFHRTGSFRDFDLSLSNFGLHVQYKVLSGNEIGSFILGWSGIDVTTGFEMSRIELSLDRNLDTNLDAVQDTNGMADVRLDSLGTLTLSANTYAIPLEVTTGLKILSWPPSTAAPASTL
jgi:hypothetical protein